MSSTDDNSQTPVPDQLELDQKKAVDIAPATAVVLHKVITHTGKEELENTKASLLWSAVAAGLVVSCSLVAEAALYAGLPEAPWRELIVSLGYSVGFIMVILGSMQLFTESTITASLPFFTNPNREAGFKTLRLWGLVLGGNLIGTFCSATLFATATGINANLSRATIELASNITHLDALHTLLNAIPAGFLIAILVWLRPNAGSSGFWCILVVLWLVGACGFTHSVVGSCEAFVLLVAGKTSLMFTIFGFILPAVIGNTIGGAIVFGILVHAHVRLSKAHADALENSSLED